MHDTQLVMYDEDYRRILAVIQRLVRDANAKGIFVVDRNGQLIGEAGEMRDARRVLLRALEDAPHFEKAQDLLLEVRDASGRSGAQGAGT